MKTTNQNIDVEVLRARVAANDLGALKQLAESGYVGAFSINDYPDFVEVKQILDDLQNEHDTLALERLDIIEKLKHGNFKSEHSGDAKDQAKRLLSGQPLSRKAGDVMEDFRAREAEIRQRLEVIFPILRALPVRLERVRESIRSTEIIADKRSAEIRSQWDAAVAALAVAIAAENAFLNDLVSRGLGRNEPIITNPYWLMRDEVPRGH